MQCALSRRIQPSPRPSRVDKERGEAFYFLLSVSLDSRLLRKHSVVIPRKSAGASLPSVPNFYKKKRRRRGNFVH